MKFNVYMDEKIREEHVDIHCKSKTPIVDKILAIGNELEILGLDEKNIQVLLNPELILYFESVDKKTFAYSINQSYEIQGTLRNLEESLKGKGFVRISKSNIINIYNIKKLVPEYNMRIRAYFENDEFLIINRAYKKDFSQALKERRNLI